MTHLYSFLNDGELYGGGLSTGDPPGPQVSVAKSRQAPPPGPPPGPDPNAVLDAIFGSLARFERRLANSEERIAAVLERMAAAEEKRASSRSDGWWSWAATLLLLVLLCYGLLRATSPRPEPYPFLFAAPQAAPPTPVLFAANAPTSFLPPYAQLGRP